jgi:hypothetical protein
MSYRESTALAVVVLAVKSPLLILEWLFKHRGLMLVALIVIVAIVGIGTFNRNNSPAAVTTTVPLPSYQQTAPAIENAPWVIETSSYLFYVNVYNDTAGEIVLQDYYVYESGKWKHHTDPLPLKPFGEARISPR